MGKEGSLHVHMYFFLFARTKRKSTKKEKSAAQNGQALLRLAMTARQIRFAQTPLFPGIAKLRIRSSTGRHVRNGRCHSSYKRDCIQAIKIVFCQLNLHLDIFRLSFFSISMLEIVTICLQTAHYENDWLCGVCHTMRIPGIALKMGVLFERSEFRPFSNDRYSQRNGSSGRPSFS